LVNRPPDVQYEGEMQSILLVPNPFSLTNDCADANVQNLDTLFDLHKRIMELGGDEERELIHMGKFFSALEATGIRRSDPRLAEMSSNLNIIKAAAFADTSIESMELDRMQFKR
jgi:hypothetical protein